VVSTPREAEQKSFLVTFFQKSNCFLSKKLKNKAPCWHFLQRQHPLHNQLTRNIFLVATRKPLLLSILRKLNGVCHN